MTVENSEAKSQKKLEVYTLGKFAVKYGENTVSENKRGSNKAWELFKYLLSNKGKQFAPEDVVEDLWPEQEYADPRAIFRYHLYRIRQDLTRSQLPKTAVDIIYSQGCYSLQIINNCWLDIDEFENLSYRARELSAQEVNASIDTYYKAISSYKGEFLPEVAGSWVLPLRNHYRSLYLKNIMELVDLLKSVGRNTEVIELCRKALLIEPFEEELHFNYMKALLEEGKDVQARGHYDHITRLMYREFGIKPSKEIQKIYHSIKNDEVEHTPNYNGIQEILEMSEAGCEALYCEPEVFRFLFERERRRSERDGVSLHLGVLTITSPDIKLLRSQKLQGVRETLKKVLLENLRKSDVISPWNDTQFALLLPGMKLEQAEIVLQRIKKRFLENYSVGDFMIQSSTHSLLS